MKWKVTVIKRHAMALVWVLTAPAPLTMAAGLSMLPVDGHAAAARGSAAKRPATTRVSATTRRPNSHASRYVNRITPRASRANADRRARRQATGASATAPPGNRRNGIRLGAPPFARWSAWNRATAPAASAAPGRAAHQRSSASGRTVRFRVQPAAQHTRAGR